MLVAITPKTKKKNHVVLAYSENVCGLKTRPKNRVHPLRRDDNVTCYSYTRTEAKKEKTEKKKKPALDSKSGRVDVNVSRVWG